MRLEHGYYVDVRPFIKWCDFKWIIFRHFRNNFFSCRSRSLVLSHSLSSFHFLHSITPFNFAQLRPKNYHFYKCKGMNQEDCCCCLRIKNSTHCRLFLVNSWIKENNHFHTQCTNPNVVLRELPFHYSDDRCDGFWSTCMRSPMCSRERECVIVRAELTHHILPTPTLLSEIWFFKQKVNNDNNNKAHALPLSFLFFNLIVIFFRPPRDREKSKFIIYWYFLLELATKKCYRQFSTIEYEKLVNVIFKSGKKQKNGPW